MISLEDRLSEALRAQIQTAADPRASTEDVTAATERWDDTRDAIRDCMRLNKEELAVELDFSAEELAKENYALRRVMLSLVFQVFDGNLESVKEVYKTDIAELVQEIAINWDRRSLTALEDVLAANGIEADLQSLPDGSSDWVLTKNEAADREHALLAKTHEIVERIAVHLGNIPDSSHARALKQQLHDLDSSVPLAVGGEDSRVHELSQRLQAQANELEELRRQGRKKPEGDARVSKLNVDLLAKERQVRTLQEQLKKANQKERIQQLEKEVKQGQEKVRELQQVVDAIPDEDPRVVALKEEVEKGERTVEKLRTTLGDLAGLQSQTAAAFSFLYVEHRRRMESNLESRLETMTAALNAMEERYAALEAASRPSVPPVSSTIVAEFSSTADTAASSTLSCASALLPPSVTPLASLPIPPLPPLPPPALPAPPAPPAPPVPSAPPPAPLPAPLPAPSYVPPGTPASPAAPLPHLASAAPTEAPPPIAAPPPTPPPVKVSSAYIYAPATSLPMDLQPQAASSSTATSDRPKKKKKTKGLW